MKKKNIIVTGGGTGGHLMPALAICEILQEQGFTPILITDNRCKKYLPDSLDFEYQIVDLQRLGSVKQIFKVIFNWLSAIISTISLILKVKPKLIIGCGGYSSAPIILASILTRTKFIVHEQNAYLGKTNYFLSYFANKIFLSFMHTINLPLVDSKKLVWTGIPILEKHNKKYKNQNLKKEDEFTILITGGSQGAAIFDEVILSAIEIIKKNCPEIKLNIIQQVRDASCEKLKQKYNKLGINSEVANFYYNIEEKYKTADFFIGRAGASTINELIQYNLPAILIPYQYAKNNHQYHNAMNLIEFEASWMIDQKKLTAEMLADKIKEILNNKSLLKDAKEQLKKLQINSRKIIAEEIYKIVDK